MGEYAGHREEGKALHPACVLGYQQSMPQTLPTETALREGERHAQGHPAKLLAASEKKVTIAW